MYGLPKVQNTNMVCEGCALGKHARGHFPTNEAWRAQSPLQLVHSDLCGLMQTQSMGKASYFLTFINDFSRYCWVYFLKHKDEAFEYFKVFKANVENQSGYIIKCLRTDRGGEFCSNDFLKFCRDSGIKRQLTSPYTPQQNGVAERKNRTLVEMVRCMMHTQGLSNFYWSKAIQTAVYLLNISYTRSLANLTSYECWFGKKPSVKHLKVFGCLAYVHVNDENRKKLDAKSEKCVFIGYSDHSKAYRFYNPISHKVVVSRDVIFDEGENWKSKKCHQLPVHDDVVEKMKKMIKGMFSPDLILFHKWGLQMYLQVPRVKR